MRTQAKMSALATCLALAALTTSSSAAFAARAAVTPHGGLGRAVEVFDAANKKVLTLSPPAPGVALSHIGQFPFVEDAQDLDDALEDAFLQMGQLAGWDHQRVVQITKSATQRHNGGRRGDVNFATVKIDDPQNLLGNLQNAGHGVPNHAMTSVDQDLLTTYLQEALQQSHATEREYHLTLSQRNMTIPEETVRATGLQAATLAFGGSADALVASAAAWEASQIPNARAGSWGHRLDQLKQHYDGDLNGLIEDHAFIVAQASADPVKDFADALSTGDTTIPGDVLLQARTYLLGISQDVSVDGVNEFFRWWNGEMRVLLGNPPATRPQWMRNWQGPPAIVYARQLQADIAAERASRRV